MEIWLKKNLGKNRLQPQCHRYRTWMNNREYEYYTKNQSADYL